MKKAIRVDATKAIQPKAKSFEEKRARVIFMYIALTDQKRDGYPVNKRIQTEFDKLCNEFGFQIEI